MSDKEGGSFKRDLEDALKAFVGGLGTVIEAKGSDLKEGLKNLKEDLAEKREEIEDRQDSE